MPTRKDCSELSRLVTELALDIGAQPGMDNLDKVTAEIQKSIPEISRDEVVNSIVEATSSHRDALEGAKAQVAALKREARGDQALRRKIAELEGHIASGTLPEQAGQMDHATEAVKSLRAIRDDLMQRVRTSEPAQRKRLLEQIDSLSAKLEAVAHVPPTKRSDVPMSKELERLAFQRDKLRRQVRDRITDLKPRTFWGKTAEVLNLARAMKTSIDLSAVLRQGLPIVASAPIRSAKAIMPMLRSFRSEEAARKVEQEIEARPNAPLYARSKLYLAPLGGTMNKREESFMSRAADKIPIVAGSQRAYVTFLNRLRADSFDALAETLVNRSGDLTLDQAKHISSMINTFTGRADFGKYEPAADALATAFFSPRYVASRFQMLGGKGLWTRDKHLRRLAAEQYGKMLASAGVVYALAMAAGADVEDDPRSSDFGKIIIPDGPGSEPMLRVLSLLGAGVQKYDGKIRIDLLAGLSQTAVLLARSATGETKSTKTGKVTPISGKDVPYGGKKWSDILADFGRYKLAPVPAAIVNVMDEEDPIGRPTSLAKEAAKLFLPISLEDVLEEMVANGTPKELAAGLVGLFSRSAEER